MASPRGPGQALRGGARRLLTPPRCRRPPGPTTVARAPVRTRDGGAPPLLKGRRASIMTPMHSSRGAEQAERTRVRAPGALRRGAVHHHHHHHPALCHTALRPAPPHARSASSTPRCFVPSAFEAVYALASDRLPWRGERRRPYFVALVQALSTLFLVPRRGTLRSSARSSSARRLRMAAWRTSLGARRAACRAARRARWRRCAGAGTSSRAAWRVG